jgi:hypothetical protein
MKRTSPLAKLCKLSVVLVLALAPVIASATSANPCPTGGCGYTWDPVERCCNAAPWSDCPDRCY